MEHTVKGVCCAYCKHLERDSCPVQYAAPWSRWKNFCSEYVSDPDVQDAVSLEKAFGARESSWTLCETALPEVSGDYLVETLTQDCTYIIEKMYYDAYAKHFMTFIPNRSYVAWQPLPELLKWGV